MSDPSRAHHDAAGLSLLVLRCQAGDEAAFARLMGEFGPRTLAYLRELVGDDAEDVQQEVWLTVYRQIARLSNLQAFRTWLFRTTRHRAIDHLRRRRREQELFAHAEDVEQVPDPGRSTGARLDLAEVAELLHQLPPLQREALLLRHADGLSYTQIALIVGCPVGTVRSRLFHARRQLEQLFTPRSGETP